MICCDCKIYLPDDHFPMIKSKRRKSYRCIACTATCNMGELKSHYRQENSTNRHKSFGYIPLHDKLRKPTQRLSKEEADRLKFRRLSH